MAKFLVVLITYNRLSYTKRTIKSILDNTVGDYYLVVVDNNSSDGTQEYLKTIGRINKLILNPENYYPGKATNIGWEEGLKEYQADYLVRIDNDFVMLPNWNIEATKYFVDDVGQIGFDPEPITDPLAEKYWRTLSNGLKINPYPGNVGGTNMIKREVWDRGLRYDESKWDNSGNPTAQEDAKFSQDIKKAGFKFGHISENLSYTFGGPSAWHEYPDYYRTTMSERGYDFLLGDIKETPTKYIIICAGEGTRWGDYLGTTKHYAVIDGEPIIERTVRLLREHNVHQNDIIVASKDYIVPGATNIYPQLNPAYYDADKFLSTMDYWNEQGRTVVLYGDVYFSDRAIDIITAYKGRDWRLFCRPGKNSLTGKIYGECFAVSFYEDSIPMMKSKLLELVKMYDDKIVTRIGGWELVRLVDNTPYDKMMDHKMESGLYYIIDDLTDDIDFPSDYDLIVDYLSSHK